MTYSFKLFNIAHMKVVIIPPQKMYVKLTLGRFVWTSCFVCTYIQCVSSFKGIACLLLTTPPEMRLWYLVKSHCDPFEKYDISGVLAQILIIVATTHTQIEESFVLVEKVFSEINEVHLSNSSSVKRIIEKLWFEITNHLEVNISPT